MENFKKYINIEKEITLESKLENDRLFVFYNNEWVQFSREKKKKKKKNPDKFYGIHIIRQKYET